MHEWPQGDLDDLKNGVLGFLAVCLCIALVVGAFALGLREGDKHCWRGTARSLDCGALGAGCKYIGDRVRVIDVEFNYAKRHPRCQAGWSAEKKREAEEYWRTDGKDQ